MRWYWIDRFVEFHSGKSARAWKTVSLSEDHLHDHFPGYPVMPPALIVEGNAQAGGLLVGEHTGYSANFILGKVPKAVFHFPATPGDTLVYDVTLDLISDEGALVSATSHIDGKLQAELEIFFANALHGDRARQLYTPNELIRMMELLGAYRVGKSADGSPLKRPAR